jgi:RNA polymerase sigma-70 factor (ECF subfamily)
LNSGVCPIVDPLELQIVERAVAGDEEGRRELFDRHREAAFRLALRITGSRHDALDVVQDSFIKAFERLDEFQRTASFKTWFLRIVNNRALDHLRWRKVRRAVSLDADEEGTGWTIASRPGEPQPGDPLERREQADRLGRAIESLPPDQRAVFALYATGEMTYGQIAEIVGVPVGTVMSRLHHARRRLRESLSDLAPPARRSDA